MSHEERRTFTLAVVVEPAEGAWHAYCPTLLDYGAATWGTTREEALEQIRAVVRMLVERMAEEKMPVLTEPADPVPIPPSRWSSPSASRRPRTPRGQHPGTLRSRRALQANGALYGRDGAREAARPRLRGRLSTIS